MKIVEFPNQVNTEEALEVLDDLRTQIADGSIKAFVAVGIGDDHTLYGFSASTKKTTRLEMMGAMMGLQWNYVEGAM
jgi:hypothetical protein